MTADTDERARLIRAVVAQSTALAPGSAGWTDLNDAAALLTRDAARIGEVERERDAQAARAAQWEKHCGGIEKNWEDLIEKHREQTDKLAAARREAEEARADADHANEHIEERQARLRHHGVQPGPDGSVTVGIEMLKEKRDEERDALRARADRAEAALREAHHDADWMCDHLNDGNVPHQIRGIVYVIRRIRDGLKNALAAPAATPAAQGAWIACSDRMPESRADVLCTNGKRQWIAFMADTGGWEWWDGHSGAAMPVPTHWCPLPPSPPQPKGGG